MKKFLIRLLFFFVVVAIIDIIFGKICDYMYEHSQSGDPRKINYAIRECNADVLIMGSSRANHHYNPQILSDSLGLSCYNLGIDGSGVILMDGFYRLITQRYVPKLIIYELTPSFDVYQNSADANNTRYLAQLKPYYREACLKQLFDAIDGRERMKLCSGLYRYNTSCFNLFRSFIGHVDIEANGFLPLKGEMSDFKPFEVDTDSIIDSLKVKYFKHFIHDCKNNGTKLLFVVSPRFGATTSIEYQPLFDMCKQEECEVLDYYCHPSFVSTKEFFNDSYHLNDVGAAEFTKTIATIIQSSYLSK